MAFQTDYNFVVLVASPSDMAEDRMVVKQAVHDWNDLNAEAEGVTLHVKLWETSSTPEQGGTGQSHINKQLVDKADLLIGMFWTKLGSPTGVAESGTVEEIDRVVDAGKPVMLYFSKRLVEPTQLKIDQLSKLEAFKEKAQKNGLQGTYKTLEELSKTMGNDLTRRVRMMKQASSHITKQQVAAAAEDAKRQQVWTSFRDKIIAGKYRAMEPGPTIATAIIPIVPLPKRLDLGTIFQQNQFRTALSPMGANGWSTDTYGHSYVTHNRLLERGGREERPPTTVTEFTDEGIIYAGDGLHVCQQDKDVRLLYFQSAERTLFTSVAEYVNVMRKCGVSGPLEWRVLLTQVGGAYIVATHASMRMQSRARQMEADTIEFEPAIIPEGLDGTDVMAIAKTLRPEMEALWKDAGLPYDPCFAE